MQSNLRRRYAQDPLGWNKAVTSRLALAILLAPFAPTPLILLAIYLDDSVGFGPILSMLSILGGAGIMGAIAALILGGPLFYLYRFMGWTRWWSYCLGGAVVAVIGVLVVFYKGPFTFDALFSEIWKFGAFFVLYGTVAGLAFWAIIRPDRLGA